MGAVGKAPESPVSFGADVGGVQCPRVSRILVIRFTRHVDRPLLAGDADDAVYRHRSRALETVGSSFYDEATNAGVDVFAITAGGAALESALPPVLRVLLEGYQPADDVSRRNGGA